MGTSRLIATLLSLFIWAVLRSPANVESALVASCSFEAGLCSWTTPSWSDGNWSRSLGSDTTETGPSQANTKFGGEWFIMLMSENFKDQSNKVQSGKTVALLTPELQRVQCIAFLYMKHGDDSIGDLTIGVAKTGSKPTEVLWKKTGKTEAVWQCENITTNVENKAVYFQANTSTVLGDIAMDQIMLYDNSCPNETDCFSLLDASASPTPTSTPTPTPPPTNTTSTTSSSTSTSSPTPTSPITTTPKEEEKAEPLDTAILLSVVIPIVVLIVAGVIAFFCYRNRQQTTNRLRRESAQQNMPYHFRNDDEEYDVIGDPDVVTDHYDTIKDKNLS